MPTLVDNMVAPLLDVLQGCWADAFTGHPAPPALRCVRWGDHTTLGMVPVDECCQGVAWVRPVNVLPTDDAAFPGPAGGFDLCWPPPQWAATVEVGVARCIPLVQDCAAGAAAKHLQMLDLRALRLLLCCVRAGGYPRAVYGDLAPQGPAGQCVQLVGELTVRLVGCNDC